MFNYRKVRVKDTADNQIIVASPKSFNQVLMDKEHPDENLILTQNVRLAISRKVHEQNLNILLLSELGGGNYSDFLYPNLMSNLPMSFVITDPNKVILEDCEEMLKGFGFQIKVLDLIDFQRDHYNPLFYISNERELVRLVRLFLRSTTPKNVKADVPFYEKAENTLWMGLFYYVWMEYPRDQRNIGSVIDLLAKAVPAKTDHYGNPLLSDLQNLILDLEKKNPRHPAVRQLKRVLFGPQDTVNSIIQMAQVRAASLDMDGIRNVLETDTLDIASLGFGKDFDCSTRTALFLCVPEGDDYCNFLASIAVDQIAQTLKHIAREHDCGSLPIPVMFYLDSAAQLQIPQLILTLSVMTHYRMSFCLAYQNLEQLHAEFGDSYMTLMDSIDHIIYKGCNDCGGYQETFKYFHGFALPAVLRAWGPVRYEAWPCNCALFTRGIGVCIDDQYWQCEHENYRLICEDDSGDEDDSENEDPDDNLIHETNFAQK